jgi:methyl-accepting chemotaxis protein
MTGFRLTLAKWLRRMADRLSSTSRSPALSADPVAGPACTKSVSDDVELAASVRVIKLLAEQLTRTSEDVQSSVLTISSGFSGMATQAREAVQLSQCRIQSQEGMQRVLEDAAQTLTQVDTIAKEARMVGLNGQIEAARAGDKGAAFSIVANETKSLAYQATSTSGSLKKMLAELSGLHQELVDALHSSETTSRSLTDEIGKAVMGLQFQDRVNQQIQHIVDALNAIQNRLTPTLAHVAPPLVEARTQDWFRWMDAHSTMASERTTARHSPASSSFGSVELF